MTDVKCPFCDGAGETAMGGFCAACAGTGTATKDKISALAKPEGAPQRSVLEQRKRSAMTEFRVSIKHISDHPIAEPGGDLSHVVEFHIDSADGLLSEDWDGGTVRGEDLKRCSQLKEKGIVTVTQPGDWKERWPEQWREEIINLALDHSASESA